MNNFRQSGAVALAAFWLIVALGGSLSALAQTPEIRPLTTGQAIERELKGDEAHSYNLALTAGQYLRVVVEQKGVDVVVTLFDPNGKKAAEVDSPNGTQGPEPISMIAETSGIYRLEVRSLEKTATGFYGVKIGELRIATINDKNRVAAEHFLIEANSLQAERNITSLQNAIKKYETALSLFRAIEDRKREAETLNIIGEVYFSIREMAKALNYFEEAALVFRVIEDHKGEATALHTASVLYNSSGEFGKSIEILNRSLLLWKKLNDKFGEANALNGLATNYESLGEISKALGFYEQALLVAKTVDNGKVVEAEILNNLGTIYFGMGEFPKALENYNAALPIFKALNDTHGEVLVLSGIASVYGKSKDNISNRKALELFNQVLSIRKATGDIYGEANTLQNIGAIYTDLGESAKALEYHFKSLPLSKAVGDKGLQAATLLNTMIAYASLGKSELASFYGKQSVNNLQQLRQSQQNLNYETQKSFLRRVDTSYRVLTSFLIEQERYVEIQQVLNAFKDQQFFDFDQKQQLKPLTFTPREAELVLRFDRIINDIGAVSGKVAALKSTIGNRSPSDEENKQLKQLEAQRKTETDKFDNFIKQAETEFAAPPDDKDKIPLTADLQEMQTALRELSRQTGQKTVAIYQFVGADKYTSLLITPDSIDAVSSPIKGIDAVSYPIKGAELNQKALQLWKLLRTPEYDPQPIAAELYKIVFAPLAAKLPEGTKTILWAMDGNLRYVPMAALHDGKGYLVERFNNVIFTRADKERLTRAVSRNWTGTGLGSGKEHSVKLFDTTYKFESLFAVETELNRIFNKANPNGIFAGDVLLDAEFTKPAMIAALKKRRSLVHIASHFKFEAGDEARSFLLLGDGSPFTLDEMKVEKDLFGGVELLTLSACQTAAQRPNANGREVDGFAELAQRLGAGAIMASLWELSDDSTAELMTRFYRTYNDSKINKAEALRTAQLSLLKGNYKENSSASRRKPLNEEDIAASIKIEKTKLRLYKSPKNAPFAHPFYWSPFVLFGNWK